MPDPRQLETNLRTIQLACTQAINDETGSVDSKTIYIESEKLKAWIHEFETMYLAQSKMKPKKADEIKREGAVLAEEAWHVFEVLVNVEIEAGGPPPTLVRWEPLPSGVVFGEVKAQMLSKLATLKEMYSNYRKHTLMS